MKSKKAAPAKNKATRRSGASSKRTTSGNLPPSFYDKSLEAEARAAIKKGRGVPDF